MKSKRYKSADLKMVLAGIATDERVCSRVASMWDGNLFDDDDANLVTGWCVDYLRSYGKVPNGQLRDLFEDWAAKADEDRARAVESKLKEVSRRSEHVPSSDYVLDRAYRYFNEVRIRRQIEEAQVELDRGRVDEAYARLNADKVEAGFGSLTHLDEDYDAWVEALDEEQEKPLLGYSGMLNRVLGSQMCRERFVGFMAPDKSFKSFWLLDVGMRAIRSGHRVAFFEVGDMTRRQVMQRMAARFAKRPVRAKKYRIPVSIDFEGNVKWKVKKTDTRLSPGHVFKRVQRACRHGRFRLDCRPAGSIDVCFIESILRDWGRQGWVPDVVLVDYADILAPPPGITDKLERVDKTWEGLRRISQEFHCLVATATQSSAAAYQNKGRTLRKQHFSDRKTKLAHVNVMVGLNVTDDWRKRCVTGVNFIVQREGMYSESAMYPVAGCLDIANPAMRSLEKFEKSNEGSTPE